LLGLFVFAGLDEKANAPGSSSGAEQEKEMRICRA
jgi:hypothetical protein